MPRPLFAAALVVRRRYLIVVPRLMPARRAGTWSWCTGRCPRRRSLSVAVLGRGAKNDSCGALQVLDRDAQAVSRGVAQLAERGARMDPVLTVRFLFRKSRIS